MVQNHTYKRPSMWSKFTQFYELNFFLPSHLDILKFINLELQTYVSLSNIFLKRVMCLELRRSGGG